MFYKYECVDGLQTRVRIFVFTNESTWMFYKREYVDFYKREYVDVF